MGRRAAVLLILATAGFPAAWWQTRGPAAPTAIVLITLDTTRADRLSPYGLMDVPMPALERLAREGIVFDRAFSVAPLTLPAHTSLFTGLFPPGHGVRDNADAGLADSHTTLAEVLRSRGYRTAAFVGSAVLDVDRGLAQGFDTYRDVASAREGHSNERYRRASAVIDDALSWLSGIGESRFFVWVHLYDAHQPYDPPEPYRSRHSDPYVGEIAYVDAQVGRLLDALDHRGLVQNAIVVVAGDHGESLGEHGERDHGVFVYDSVLRVPLIVRAPGIAPARVGSVVRLVDVMPTVLELCQIGAPPTHGVSLTGLMNGETGQPGLEAYAESRYPLRFGWSPLRMLVRDRFKLIAAPRPELYDLAVDPFEEANLYDTRPALADAMMHRLQVVGEEIGHTGAPAEGTDAPPDLKERLAALGYVSGPMVNGASDRAALPDPKDCLTGVAPDVGRAATRTLPSCAAAGRVARADQE